VFLIALLVLSTLQRRFSYKKNRKLPAIFAVSGLLIPADHDLARSGYFAVKFLRIVEHLDGEGFLVAAQFQVGRYPPRVPAGAVSAKGHHALGDSLTVRPCDKNPRFNLTVIRRRIGEVQDERAADENDDAYG
jgi:hypothetical protein